MRLGLIVIVFVFSSVMPPTRAFQDAPVWFWFATCGGPNMTLEVRFDKRTVEKVVLPLCRAARDSSDSQGETSRIEFSFKPNRPLVWAGYRERADRTPAGQLLEGYIWQAGADPDWLTIGVSFMTRSRVLMNTIHIAHPDRRDESTIAKGLSLITYPAER